MTNKARQILAANWKMNGSTEFVENYFREFLRELEQVKARQTTSEVVFALPYTLLSFASKLLENKSVAKSHSIKIAAQNMHWEDKGAFTGEISASMLKEVGISTVILGHSERRQYFGETDATVAKKLVTAESHNLTPIVCIGETREQREAGETFKVIDIQLKATLPLCKKPATLVIAYEPVWAIGTGLTASPGQAQEVHNYIRKNLVNYFGEAAAVEIPLLYGGSAKASNFADLIAQNDINGGLVGGASLVAKEFSAMYSAL